MKKPPVFPLINLALLAASGFLIYYLATTLYRKPPEVDKALAKLHNTEVDPASTEAAEDPESKWPSLTNPTFMDVMYRITPTPSPTPRPTPRPPTLFQAIHPWAVIAMGTNTVQIRNQETSEVFEMSLNGPAKKFEKQSLEFEVQLCKINFDADPPEATFCFEDEEIIKKYGE